MGTNHDKLAGVSAGSHFTVVCFCFCLFAVSLRGRWNVACSDSSNRHSLRSLARLGAGAFQFFDRKSKSKWEGQVKDQLLKASQPSLSSIEVAWQQFNEDDAVKLVQAPTNVMALFNGCRQVVYGFVSNCTQVCGFLTVTLFMALL